MNEVQLSLVRWLVQLRVATNQRQAGSAAWSLPNQAGSAAPGAGATLMGPHAVLFASAAAAAAGTAPLTAAASLGMSGVGATIGGHLEVRWL